MKIDLRQGQALEVSTEYQSIKITTFSNVNSQSVNIGMNDAVAFNAALGEIIRELRKKQSTQ